MSEKKMTNEELLALLEAEREKNAQLESAKKEAEENLEAVKQDLAAMQKAEPLTQDNAQPAVKMVRIKLSKDKENRGDLFVSVNCRPYLLQRGVAMDVPDFVAEVIENSLRSDQETYERILALMGE